jgi:hypothetical protein
VSNLIVEVAQGLGPAELRRSLMELAERERLPYAVVIERLDPAMGLVSAYKLFPDGHTEPLSAGLRLWNVNPRMLRTIVGAGAEPAVYLSPLLDPPFPPQAAVAPAVILGDVELRSEPAREKPPILGHPLFDRRP